MKDEIVSFEVAKLAKEKGFDEACEYGFIIYRDGSYVDHQDWGKRGNRNSHHDSTCAAAPTQSLLQRWLREKYDIQIEIQWDSVTYGYKVWHPDETNWTERTFTYMMHTYEQALEQALIKGLKLIK